MSKFPDKIEAKLICLDCGKKFEATVGPEEPDPVCPDCGSEYIDLAK
jgi:DNA-directed RNA polymerase subunit RPC12/RpoP